MVKKNVQLAFYDDISKLFEQDELEEFLLNENKFYREYAEEYWLLQYHELKRKSERANIPPITAVLSKAPSSPSNGFNSDVENSVIDSVEAREKLEILIDAVESLDEEHQELIKTKYFKRRSDGKLYEDSYVYDSLGLSRTQYYRFKRVALEILGDILYQKHMIYLKNK